MQVQPGEDPKPDVDEIARHLHHLTRRWQELDEPCLLEIVHLSAEDRAQVKQVAHYTPDDMGIDLAADDIAAFNALRINAYVTVNPVSAANRPKAGRRASAEHILASFFHFADADTAEAAENIRNFVGPKATFQVITGTQPCIRPHVYWELEEPTRNLDAWSRTQAAISDTLKTDRVIDPPRIMRLGGTVNWPKPQKAAKGYVAELTRFKIHEDRQPVTSERMARAFAQAATGASDKPHIDLGPQPLDREKARTQALSGQEWHNNLIKSVASLVSKGLSDDEIQRFHSDWTLEGYTAADTAREVQTAIDGARAKGWTPEPDFTPNFDHAPAPSQSSPTPQSEGWKVQTAAAFTAEFVAPEYIVEGVVQRGRLYTFTAPTGSGKTAVMLYAAAAIATGMQFCGKEVEHGDVLFLAGENPDDVRARVIAMLDFYGIEPDTCRIHFISGTFSIRADMERLKEAASKLSNLVLVVIDTFSAYFDGDDENSNAQTLDFARVARQITQIDSKPAVIMPAHPIKNASKGNLAPKGGSSLVNEVDGNLTLWSAGGLVSLHWQVKFRGPDFEPLKFELERTECEKIMDRRGRIMPTILAKPVLDLRAQQIARDTLRLEDQLLLNISDSPALTQRERCTALGIVRDGGEPNTSRMSDLIDRLARDKLIRKYRRNWELTKNGERAVEDIISGERQAEEDAE